MTKTEAARIFGNFTALAKALGITRSAVSQWPEDLPLPVVDRVMGAALRLGLINAEGEGSPPSDRDRTTADGSGAAGATICHGQKADVEQQTPGNDDDAALNAA